MATIQSEKDVFFIPADPESLYVPTTVESLALSAASLAIRPSGEQQLQTPEFTPAAAELMGRAAEIQQVRHAYQIDPDVFGGPS